MDMLKNQFGSSTIIALLLVAIFATMGAGLAPLIQNTSKFSKTDRDDLSAYYAAEAGAKRSILEFKKIPKGETPDFSWFNSERLLVADNEQEYYKVIVYLPSDTGKTPLRSEQLKVELEKGNSLMVQSTGIIRTADTAEDVKRTITFSVTATRGSGSDVFKYAAFSNEDMYICNTPSIDGNIGSNKDIKIDSTTKVVSGTAYQPKPYQYYNVYWTANYNALPPFKIANPAGTLDVASLIPAMPVFTATGSALSAAGGTYGPGSYYYNGTLTPSGSITTSGNTVIYVNGNIKLDLTDKIIGDNLTVYSTGNIELANNSSIQATNLQLYAKGNISFTNNASINGETITIQTTNTSSSSVNYNSASSINRNSATAVTKIYSNGGIQFTNTFTLGGIALVVGNGIEMNSIINASSTILVSASTAQITNGSKIAGIYTNGKLNINSSPTIAPKGDTLVQGLGLGGTTSVTFGDWIIN